MIYKTSYYPTLDNIINDFFGTSSLTKQREPLYQVHHTNDGAYLTMEVPGFNKGNLKVELEDGILFIEGKRTYKINEEEKERTINSSFRIGKEFSQENLEATIEDGILSVFVPVIKKVEKKKRVSLL